MSRHFLFVHVNEWALFRSSDTIPISLGYILSVLKKYGYDGEIIGEFKDRPLSPGRFQERLAALQPLLIGFTTYAENIDRVRFWARLAKHLQPEIPIILGGSQITFMPKEALLQLPEIDFLCRGDGEMVMPELARVLRNGGDFKKVPGISYLADGKPVETSRVELPEDLDALPSPYLDNTLDVSSKEKAILLTSRGCTNNCAFCYTPKASNYRYRYHSIERVIAEMQQLQKKGVSDFWFADPNFASSKERVEELCRAIKKHVPGIGFWCQGRYQYLDLERIELLRQAGAHTIAFGLESSSPETLRAINKMVQPKRLANVISLCQCKGIDVELFTLYGLPGDTFATSFGTLEFVRECGVKIVGNSISQQMHLFFGTPVAETPQRWGISLLARTFPSYHSVCRDFVTREMAAAEMEKISLLWRLYREDFSVNIALGQNLFEVAGFINRHRQKLQDAPMADILLSRIYLQLDEPRAAARCLRRLRSEWPDHPEAVQERQRPLVGYKSKRRLQVGKGFKIIYDCKGFYNGEVVAETVQSYQIGVVGTGQFLPEFEENLLGMKAGSGTQFDLSFPETYGSNSISGKTLAFQVYLYSILEPIIFHDEEDMAARAVQNMYRFDDLVSLKKFNETLYYLVLRDSVLHSLKGNLNDQIALFDYYLKLGFLENALDLAHSLRRESSVQAHIGRILQVNGYAEEALEFLNPQQGSGPEVENQRIRAFMQLDRFDQAEVVADNPLLATNLETLHLRVKLAALANLPIEQYLSRLDTMLDVQVKMATAEAQNTRSSCS